MPSKSSSSKPAKHPADEIVSEALAVESTKPKKSTGKIAKADTAELDKYVRKFRVTDGEDFHPDDYWTSNPMGNQASGLTGRRICTSG